jgi:hypothetical protein
MKPENELKFIMTPHTFNIPQKCETQMKTTLLASFTLLWVFPVKGEARQQRQLKSRI